MSVCAPGAEARFAWLSAIDGKTLHTAVTVIAGVLDDRSQSPTVDVAVTETDAATGAVVFRGSGSTNALSLQMGVQVNWAHLQTALQVADDKGDAVRVVHLNVVWHASAQAQTAPADGASTAGRKWGHEGTLRVANATGVVQVSNPAAMSRR